MKRCKQNWCIEPSSVLPHLCRRYLLMHISCVSGSVEQYHRLQLTLLCASWGPCSYSTQPQNASPSSCTWLELHLWAAFDLHETMRLNSAWRDCQWAAKTYWQQHLPVWSSLSWSSFCGLQPANSINNQESNMQFAILYGYFSNKMIMHPGQQTSVFDIACHGR